MGQAINIERMRWERDPILSKFSFEFTQKINSEPMHHMVYKMLMDDETNVYHIIETLVNLNLSNIKIIEEMNKSQIK